MSELKVIILTNNPIAIPGIKEFVFYGKVAAIGIPNRNKEMQHILEQLLEGTGVPLLLINKKESSEQLKEALQQYKPTACLMMTFPFIIPPEILQLPEKGFINFHYGLLPQCRGPQPILRHLLNNDKEAGVTVHKVDEGIDTGPIIIQEKTPIDANDTYGTLQSKLAFLAAKLAANLLKILSYGSILPAIAQDETKAAYYEMPGAEELTINWKEMEAEKIVRLVNACNPWNKGAGTMFNDWVFGIIEAEISDQPAPEANDYGTIVTLDKQNGMLVKSCDGKLVKINIVYLQEGFFSSHRLFEFGLQKGHCLK